MWYTTPCVQQMLMSPPVSAVPAFRPLASLIPLPNQDVQRVLAQWHAHTGLVTVASVVRVLGYLLVVTTSGLQVPDILKVLKLRRGEGVSLFTTAMLLFSTSANLAYCINSNFPLSMWAESVPLMAQYVTLTCLLLLYRGYQRHMLAFVLLYVLVMLPLLLGLVPGYLVACLKVTTLPLTLLGKVNQMYVTQRHGVTGKLSKMSIFLLNLRSCGRLLTSLFDTRDWLLVLCYGHACFWNTLLTCQVIYCHTARRPFQRHTDMSQGPPTRRRVESEGSSSDCDNADCELSPETSFPKRRKRCNSFIKNHSSVQTAELP